MKKIGILIFILLLAVMVSQSFAAYSDCAFGDCGSTPGGSDTQIQFNNSGAFGGDSGLIYNSTTKNVRISGINDSELLTIKRGTDTSPTENIFTIYNAAGTEVLFQIDSTGMPSYQPSATSPAVVAGTGAGTGPILTIVGSDTGGIITLTTGTSCATSATVLTATFETLVLSFAPGIILYPMDTDSAALTGAAQVYTNSSTTTFTVKVGSTALADSTEYIWAYKLAAY